MKTSLVERTPLPGDHANLPGGVASASSMSFFSASVSMVWNSERIEAEAGAAASSWAKAAGARPSARTATSIRERRSRGTMGNLLGVVGVDRGHDTAPGGLPSLDRKPRRGLHLCRHDERPRNIRPDLRLLSRSLGERARSSNVLTERGAGPGPGNPPQRTDAAAPGNETGSRGVFRHPRGVRTTR